MAVAQKLYEAGKITYMRTDSTNLSKLALENREVIISKEFGEKVFKNKTVQDKIKRSTGGS
jgi:DNA topoisomerase I